MTRPITLVLLLATLGGCARDTGTFPSLAPRAAEGQGFGEPPPRPAPTATPDPALDARITELDGKLATIATGFDGDAARAERLAGAARGKPVGSDAWLDAEVALAGLDDWRAQASSLATDAAALATDRAAALAPPYPALDALVARVAAEAARQGERIDALAASLPAA